MIMRLGTSKLCRHKRRPTVGKRIRLGVEPAGLSLHRLLVITPIVGRIALAATLLNPTLINMEVVQQRVAGVKYRCRKRQRIKCNKCLPKSKGRLSSRSARARDPFRLERTRKPVRRQRLAPEVRLPSCKATSAKPITDPTTRVHRGDNNCIAQCTKTESRRPWPEHPTLSRTCSQIQWRQRLGGCRSGQRR